MPESPLVKLLGGIRQDFDGFGRNNVDFLSQKLYHFFKKKLLAKIEKPLYLRAPKELEAHILRNRSTGEYYQHTKYERLTTSEFGDRVIFRFGPVVFFEKNVQLLAPNLNIFPPKTIDIWMNPP